jgi:hypothetical protein
MKSWGKDSVMVEYQSDVDLAITVRVWRRRHWKLGFVTLVTFGIKLAAVLVGGIFIKAPGYNLSFESFPLQNYWRDSYFEIPSDTIESTRFRNMALARAISDWTNTTRWEDSTYVYTPVDYGESVGTFNLVLEGIKANWSCVDTKATYEKVSEEEDPWSATLAESQYKDSRWINYCAQLDSQESIATE